MALCSLNETQPLIARHRWHKISNKSGKFPLELQSILGVKQIYFESY